MVGQFDYTGLGMYTIFNMQANSGFIVKPMHFLHLFTVTYHLIIIALCNNIKMYLIYSESILSNRQLCMLMSGTSKRGDSLDCGS